MTRCEIDLGPIVLPAGAGTAGDGPVSREAGAEDVVRFEALMREGARGGLEDFGDAPWADRPGQEATLAGEIERLWVSDGAMGRREVRMALRDDVLPATSIRLYESGGALQVELFIASAAIAQWMATRAERVARDLGTRLGREVCVTVGGGDAAGELVRATWFPGRPE